MCRFGVSAWASMKSSAAMELLGDLGAHYPAKRRGALRVKFRLLNSFKVLITAVVKYLDLLVTGESVGTAF
jgi:hypothetical protein